MKSPNITVYFNVADPTSCQEGALTDQLFDNLFFPTE